MGIRQRTWTWKGEERTAWVVDYFDTKGKRRLKTFRTKREADDWRSETRIDVKRGSHIADRDSVTVEDAGKLWVADGEESGLQRSSLTQARQHVDLHIVPFIGRTKISKLNVPALRAFESRLHDEGRSPAMVKKVLTSLGGIIANAQEHGLAAHNAVREMRKNRNKRRVKVTADRKKRLEVGVDIPEPAEIRAIMSKASGFRRAFFATAALAGLRSSELRGLRWVDVDFTKGTISVRQRADQWGEIDAPKSDAGTRTIPVSALVINALKEWRLVCPKRATGRMDRDGKPIKELCYVFPRGTGKIESQQNIVKRHWHPLQVAAGVSVPVLDDDGNPVQEPVLGSDRQPVIGSDGAQAMRDVMKAKYSGLHALRHFFCSWCAARKEDGGLGLPLKTVQARMGHSTLAMTADRYGHLFPSQDDAEVLAAGERALMGT